MNPIFEYQNPKVDASKLAYDLAMTYARVKLDEMLRTKPGYFRDKPAPPEVEEVAFLEQQFMFAYDYYAAHEPGDLERTLREFGT